MSEPTHESREAFWMHQYEVAYSLFSVEYDSREACVRAASWADKVTLVESLRCWPCWQTSPMALM